MRIGLKKLRGILQDPLSILFSFFYSGPYLFSLLQNKLFLYVKFIYIFQEIKPINTF